MIRGSMFNVNRCGWFMYSNTSNLLNDRIHAFGGDIW